MGRSNHMYPKAKGPLWKVKRTLKSQRSGELEWNWLSDMRDRQILELSCCGCLHKIRPVNTRAWSGEYFWETSDGWWLLGEEESDFLKDEATMFQWMALDSWVDRQHIPDRGSLLSRAVDLGRVRGTVTWGWMWSKCNVWNYIQNR